MTEHPPAGLFRRLAAAFYDAIVVTALCMLSTLCVIVFRGGESINPGNHFYQAVLVATVAVFYIGFWVYGGQTLGMRAWRIRAERLSGEAIGWKIGFVRFVAGILSILPAGLGLFWMVVDPQHLAWHDRISKTRIVQVPKEPRRKIETG